MGIQGLLPWLEKIKERVHISKYKGQTVAIDAYCWLHKGIYHSGHEISKGNSFTKKLIQFSINRLKLLQRNKVRPIMIFDGDKLPIKSKIEDNRLK